MSNTNQNKKEYFKFYRFVIRQDVLETYTSKKYINTSHKKFKLLSFGKPFLLLLCKIPENKIGMYVFVKNAHKKKRI